jgi:exopolyphosphatase/guanosine-5'-triphosphate,3'-diphosphate pyrophosphatase
LKRTKYGAIDIGSNAVRLLLVNVYEHEEETTFKKVSLVRVPLRLGQDVFKQGAISDEKAIDFERTMLAFEQLMKVHKVDKYRACATSAMRDAANGISIIEGVKARTDINIEIISGDEEAELIRSTHIEERLEDNHDFLYVDVGGGSTEISFYKNGELSNSKSFNIGTIRLLNNQVSDKKWESMKLWIKDVTKGHRDLDIIGSGGNINKIYKILEKENWQGINYLELKGLLEELNHLSVDERMMTYRLHPDRADVIVHAGEIFKRVMKWSGGKEIQVPKLGLADGLIKSMHKGLSFKTY